MKLVDFHIEMEIEDDETEDDALEIITNALNEEGVVCYIEYASVNY